VTGSAAPRSSFWLPFRRFRRQVAGRRGEFSCSFGGLQLTGKTALNTNILDWIDYISKLSTVDRNTTFEFNPPATDETLQHLYSQFQLSELPDELKTFYKQTDGVSEFLNGQKIGYLIWSSSQVVETNQEYRGQSDFKELYMSFDQLLFIADAGNGDLFGFITLNGQFDRRDVFVWNHEDDSRTWVAPDLATFIKWWTDGTISV
jgi:hypothetical protein